MNLLLIVSFIFDIDFPIAKTSYLWRFRLTVKLLSIHPFKDSRIDMYGDCTQLSPLYKLLPALVPFRYCRILRYHCIPK
jgi:hypothetical protein